MNWGKTRQRYSRSWAGNKPKLLKTDTVRWRRIIKQLNSAWTSAKAKIYCLLSFISIALLCIFHGGENINSVSMKRKKKKRARAIICYRASRYALFLIQKTIAVFYIILYIYSFSFFSCRYFASPSLIQPIVLSTKRAGFRAITVYRINPRRR